MAPKERRSAPCQDIVWEGDDVDLARLPIQTCWPGDVGAADHVGAHRHARAAQDAAEPRHLSAAGDRAQQGDHALARTPRRRARFPRSRAGASPGTPFPIAVALGADPATILGRGDAGSGHAVRIPVRGTAARLAHRDRQVPHARPAACRRRPRSCSKASSGPTPTTRPATRPRLEGPFGDHTGYYNEVERFPVLTIERITMRRDPIYHSTYTGKPPDEPSVLGVALNEVFVPLLQKQFPGDRRLLPAARRLQLPDRRRRDEEAVRRAREARDVRRLELPAPVHVHEDHRRHRRRRRHPRLEGRDLGADDARRSGARHADRRTTPIDYLDFASPVAGSAARWASTRPTSGPARRTRAVGTADRDGRGGQGARRRDVEASSGSDAAVRRALAQRRGQVRATHRRAARSPRERSKSTERARAQRTGRRARDDHAGGRSAARDRRGHAARRRRDDRARRVADIASATASTRSSSARATSSALRVGRSMRGALMSGRASPPRCAPASQTRSRSSSAIVVGERRRRARLLSADRRHQRSTPIDGVEQRHDDERGDRGSCPRTQTTTSAEVADDRGERERDSGDRARARATPFAPVALLGELDAWRARARVRSSRAPPRRQPRERKPREAAVRDVAMRTRRSAAVHQQADDEADRGGDADRLPRIVVHVVVGRARRVLGAVDGLALRFPAARSLAAAASPRPASAGRAPCRRVSVAARFSMSSASESTVVKSSTSDRRGRWSCSDSF